MVATPSVETELKALDREPRSLRQWLTTFHLALVVLDPYTHESAWLLKTGARILDTFEGADCRVGFLLTCSDAEATQFMGPLVDDFLVFVDPERKMVADLKLDTLPAFVHLGLDGSVAGSAEGWDPAEWRAAFENLARMMSWQEPLIPAPGDPAPYPGTPALG